MAEITMPGDRLPHLGPYVPRLLVRWLRDFPQHRHLIIDGTLAFLDISGFTRLTERLARQGRVGAEELSDALSATFSRLLGEAYDEGADLVKWGGDALLLLFEGREHAAHASRAAFRMRKALAEVGRIDTSTGPVRLKVSVGIHSGRFTFFLVGDPESHRELLVGGPDVSTTVAMEAAAGPGQIVLSPGTANRLPPGLVSASAEGLLLKRQPRAEPVPGLSSGGHESPVMSLEDALPAAIRNHLVQQAGEAEHRPVAVAFVRFSGTDALLEGAGPEALAQALDECVRNVQHAAAEYGVTFFETDIDRDGGKVMLTAGAPLSSGNDVEHLLRAARLIVRRAGRLPLQIGVNHGHVFAGDFGPAFRRTYSVKGDAVNLAARLTARAAPGQVLATRSTIEPLLRRFDTTPLPSFQVKGKSAAVRAVAVGDPISGRTVDLDDLLLIGRDGELEQILQALDEAKARKGMLVEIVGEEGVGKSRLAAEVVARAQNQEVVVVQGSCDEYESGTPYFPFHALLRNLLGIPAGSETDASAERLRARVEANAPHLVPWLPLLGIPLDTPLPPTRETEQLDEEFRRNRLEEVLCEFFRLVQPTPAVFFFEDSHLMDEASANLLRRIAQDLPSAPWLVMVTRRDEETGFAPEAAPRTLTIELGPLRPEAAVTLAEIATDVAPLPPQELEILASRAGGNPLFLRELVAAASRSGSVDDLPDSLEQLVIHRIDELPPQDRAVLRHASVLGAAFAESLLLHMLPAALRAGDHLERLLNGFLVPDGQGELRFRHTLLRDVAYEGLAYQRRRLLHALAGETIERSSQVPESQSEVLSWHFFQAGRFEQAWTYSRLAGERARAKYAHAEAAEFFRRAAESARRTAVADDIVARVWESLGDVRYLVGHVDQSGAAYRSARQLVRGQPVQSARLILKEARLKQRLGRYPQALRSLSRGMHFLEGVDAAEAGATRALLATRYAICRVSQGRYRDAAGWGRLAVREALSADDKPALAEAYLALHTVDLWSGEPEEAPYGKSALALFEELDDASGQAHCLNNLAMRALFEGRWSEALDMFRGAADSFRTVGDAANEANAKYNVADVLIRQGHWEEAEPLLKEAGRVARAVGDEELVALCVRESGRAASRASRHDEAMARFTDARSRLAELGEPHEVVDTDTAIAESLLLRGDWDGALELAADALGRAESLGAVQILPTLHRIRGVAQSRSGHPVEARAELTEGLRLSESPDVRHEQAFLLAELSEVAAAEGDPRAPELRESAGSLLRLLGVVARPTPPELRQG